MPRVLTNLRIDEVSAVDRGAGHGVKIMLMKRADPVERTAVALTALRKSIESINASGMIDADKRAAISESVEQAKAYLKTLAAVERGDDADDEDERTRSDDVVSLAVAAHGGKWTRLEAAHWLRSTALGREFHRVHKGKENTMSRLEDLRAVVKRGGGFMPLIKTFVGDQTTCGISEAELTQLATDHAKSLYPTMRSDQAFAKLYSEGTDGLMLRRAMQLAKACEFSASVSEGGASLTARGDNLDFEDAQAALDQLAEIGREKWPNASSAQQFSRAFSDPANATLAKRAHQRPAATTSYPFPR